jgi:DNA-directed RNA polymerase specialized sigma24 family protein
LESLASRPRPPREATAIEPTTPDDQEGSITAWIGGLKAGDEEAARLLWERYFDRLVRLARDRLRAARRPGADQDEEDVALSAFNSVYLRAAGGQFPRLADRDGLWALLVVVAARKALNSARDQRRRKRGGGRVLAETDADARRDDGEPTLATVVGREPTPEFAALVAESLQVRLAGLDEVLRRVALSRLEGYSNGEIATRLGCTERTVIRKVELIRRLWSEGAT